MSELIKPATVPSVDDVVTEASQPEDDKIECWCGAVGTFGELFDSEVFDQSCGGSGYLHCECGGDLCVCHHHGEVECYGCEDCDFDDDDFNDDDGYEY